MKKNAINILLLYAVVMSLTACRKDLCYDHDEHSYGYRAQIISEWERAWERNYGKAWESNWSEATFGIAYDVLQPAASEGIAVIQYNEQDGELTHRSEHHIAPTGGNIITDANTRALLFYNDDSEYIIFNEIASLSRASATTRTRTRASFTELHADERTVSPPDMLYGHYIADYHPEAALGYTPLPVIMRPLVYTYIIRYVIESGSQYVALARGALAGMAESVFLSDGSTDINRATLLYDCTQTNYGVEARVMSFGVPGFPDTYYSRIEGEEEHHYDISLELMLTNGKTLTYEFDITEQMKDQPRGGVITVDGISITDSDGKSEGSGFDARVEDWGEQKDIDLPL